MGNAIAHSACARVTAGAPPPVRQPPAAVARWDRGPGKHPAVGTAPSLATSGRGTTYSDRRHPSIFPAIARKTSVAPDGLEPSLPEERDFKSAEARSSGFHGAPFPPPLLGKRAAVTPPRSTDLRALGYTLATRSGASYRRARTRQPGARNVQGRWMITEVGGGHAVRPIGYRSAVPTSARDRPARRPSIGSDTGTAGSRSAEALRDARRGPPRRSTIPAAPGKDVGPHPARIHRIPRGWLHRRLHREGKAVCGRSAPGPPPRHPGTGTRRADVREGMVRQGCHSLQASVVPGRRLRARHVCSCGGGALPGRLALRRVLRCALIASRAPRDAGDTGPACGEAGSASPGLPAWVSPHWGTRVPWRPCPGRRYGHSGQTVRRSPEEPHQLGRRDCARGCGQCLAIPRDAVT